MYEYAGYLHSLWGAAIGSHGAPIPATRSTCALAVKAQRIARHKDGVPPSFHFDDACLGAIQTPGCFLHESIPGRHPVPPETRGARLRSTTCIDICRMRESDSFPMFMTWRIENDTRCFHHKKATGQFRRRIDIGIACAAYRVSPGASRSLLLYGGLGGHGVSSGPQASTNDGALVIVSQTDGSTTLVGHPAGVARISGLAFGLDGTLFGATQSGGGYPPPPGPIASSNLIRIDPDTGALISSVPIIAGTAPLCIADLAVHPTTGVLYGMGGRGPHRDRQGYRVRNGLHHRHDDGCGDACRRQPANSSQASPLHLTERCTCRPPDLFDDDGAPSTRF